MTQPTKWLALGALVALWIGLVYVYVIDVAPPIEVPLTYRSGQPVVSAKGPGASDTWQVQSLRAQARELPIAPKRNIFADANVTGGSDPRGARTSQQRKQPNNSAAVSATPPAPPPPTPEELAQQQAALAAQAAEQQEQLRRKQLQEQMGQYRYLGYANQNGVRKAFLGKGREIYIIRQGDTLEGKFQVALIEATAVKLFDADSKLETVLKLEKVESPATGA